MINNMEIMYYENIIEIVSENRRINELIMTPNFMQYFTESQEELALCEAKVIDSVLNFIKTIFDKVIQFFKKIANIISDKRHFTVNKNLLSSVQNKLKSMDKEEKDRFNVKIKVNSIGSAQYVDYLIKKSEDGMTYLANMMNNIKGLLDGTSAKDIDNKFDINLEEPKVSERNITYNDLKEIITQYENSYNKVKNLRTQIQNNHNSMNKYKRTIDEMIRKNTDVKNNEILNKYKNKVIEICNMIMKVNSEIIKEMSHLFNSYEKVLKTLVPQTDMNKDVNEYVSIEFINAVNKNDRLLLRIMLKDSLLVDKSFKSFDAQLKYVEKHIKDLYDDHDGTDFPEDKSEWTLDRMTSEMVNVVNNFSKERLRFLKKLVKHIYTKK